MNNLFLLVAGGIAPAVAATAAERPNVVLIMLDDMGYSDFGCYGGEIQTPNIDKLSESGVRFTQFYNASRSSATRASLMTGLFQHQVGVGQAAEDPNTNGAWIKDWGTDGYRGYMNRNCVTIAEVLHESGYKTYMTGKWHLGMHGDEKKPCQRGFDRYYGVLAGAMSYLRPSDGKCLTLDNTDLPAPEAPYYTTDAFTDYAMKFIGETPKRDPFFLYLSFNAPHWPLHAKEQDIEKYKDIYREGGWDKIREARYERMKQMGIISEKCELATWECRKWDELTAEEQNDVAYRMAVYAAQVDCADQNVGRLVEYLRERGDYDNTLFFVLSDNGACAEPYRELGGGKMSHINNPSKIVSVSYGLAWAQVSNTPFRRYKTRSFEGGISTPLIISWKDGFKGVAGELRTAPAYVPDIMSTIVDITGAKYPKKYHGGNDIKPMVGESLRPVVKDDVKQIHEYMYWEHQDNQAIRKGDWKAVREQNSKRWELFNIVDDRAERHDLAAQNPEMLNELKDKWSVWAKENQVLPKKDEAYVKQLKTKYIKK